VCDDLPWAAARRGGGALPPRRGIGLLRTDRMGGPLRGPAARALRGASAGRRRSASTSGGRLFGRARQARLLRRSRAVRASMAPLTTMALGPARW